MGFGRFGRRFIEANVDGGALSADGGLMLLRQVDRKLGLSRAIAAALHDPRAPERIIKAMRGFQFGVKASKWICSGGVPWERSSSMAALIMPGEPHR
ncbi:MAG: transposase [Pseudomonadota bacterium]